MTDRDEELEAQLRARPLPGLSTEARQRLLADLASVPRDQADSPTEAIMDRTLPIATRARGQTAWRTVIAHRYAAACVAAIICTAVAGAIIVAHRRAGNAGSELALHQSNPPVAARGPSASGERAPVEASALDAHLATSTKQLAVRPDEAAVRPLEVSSAQPLIRTESTKEMPAPAEVLPAPAQVSDPAKPNRPVDVAATPLRSGETAEVPREAIAIKASEVLENLKKYDAIYESGFSASGTEEGTDRMELRFGGSRRGVKRRWMLTCGDDRFGYTEEVIEYEKLKYQQLMERRRQGTTRGLRQIGPTSDQDEDSLEPLLTTIRTRRWGYWGPDLSGHYYEDTGFQVTPEDKAMERGQYLQTVVRGPADTSMDASKYVFLYALGRFFSKDLDKVTRVEKAKDGFLLVSALGTCGKSRLAPYSSGRWELEIEPAAAWMVRKARFYSDAQPQSNWAGVWTEMANSGTVWYGPYCIPKEAAVNCFGSINGVETKRLTFDPVVGKFDGKLYSIVRQAVGYSKDPGVEVHDSRVSPDTVTQPNGPKPEGAQH